MKEWYDGERLFVSLNERIPEGYSSVPVSLTLRDEKRVIYVRSVESGEFIPFTLDGEVLSFSSVGNYSMYEIGFSADGYIMDTARDILNEYKDAFLELAK